MHDDRANIQNVKNLNFIDKIFFCGKMRKDIVFYWWKKKKIKSIIEGATGKRTKNGEYRQKLNSFIRSFDSASLKNCEKLKFLRKKNFLWKNEEEGCHFPLVKKIFLINYWKLYLEKTSKWRLVTSSNGTSILYIIRRIYKFNSVSRIIVYNDT